MGKSQNGNTDCRVAEEGWSMEKRPFVIILVTLLFLVWCQESFALVTAVERAGGDLLAHARQLQQENRDHEALQLYGQILHDDPDNYEVLLNAALLHLREGWLYSTDTEKKKHYLKLYEFAEKAFHLKPDEYRARLLNSIGKAKVAGYASAGEQVRIARELKQELNALIKAESNDPTSIYILSWLNFKVGQVGPIKRMLAATLFGGLPEDLTTGKAISLMERAIQLRPGYSVYYYDLGMFYQRLAEVEKARSLFAKVITMPPQEPEEVVYRKKAEQKLQELAEDRGRSSGRLSSVSSGAGE